MTRYWSAIPLALVVAACATAPAPAPPPAAAAPAVEVLTDGKGMTLYVFDRDVAGSGKSMCNGPCAVAWPPLLAAGDVSAFGQYTIITRDDGIKQWAYKGKPLYTWTKDTRPGDRTGDNFNNVWRLATP